MNQSFKSSRACFECGSADHMKADCEQYKEKIENKKKEPCRYCKEPGHHIKECNKLNRKKAATEKFQKTMEFPDLCQVVSEPKPIPKKGLWAFIVKNSGDPTLFQDIENEVERKRKLKAESEKEKEKEKAKEIDCTFKFKSPEKSNQLQQAKMVKFRGMYWFLFTKDTVDEFDPETELYDLRDIASRLRYDYQMQEELEEENEEHMQQLEYDKYRKEKDAERVANKARMTEEEYAQWDQDEINSLIDDMDEDHYHSEAMYLSTAPGNYSMHYAKTGQMLNTSLRSLENEERKRSLKTKFHK
jgi:hypothetical protein